MAGSDLLHASTRPRANKGAIRALRREGRVPAILYGDNQPPQNLSLAIGDLNKLYQSGRMMSTLLELEVDGKKQRAIMRDVQLHPVKDTILHADLLRLAADAKINVEVPVVFRNEDTCPGLKRGGVLNVVRYTVELSCPADQIPENIELDLAEADMNDSIHISDVALPEGVVPTISDRDFTIATIAAPASLKSEAEEAEGAAELEGEAGEGEEVETEEKSDGAEE